MKSSQSSKRDHHFISFWDSRNVFSLHLLPVAFFTGSLRSTNKGTQRASFIHYYFILETLTKTAVPFLTHTSFPQRKGDFLQRFHKWNGLLTSSLTAFCNTSALYATLCWYLLEASQENDQNLKNLHKRLYSPMTTAVLSLIPLVLDWIKSNEHENNLAVRQWLHRLPWK